MSKRLVTLQSDEIDELLEEYSKALDAKISRYDKVSEFKTFLEDFDHHEQCYLETDLSLRKITWSYGLQKWLGYSKTEIEGEGIDHMKNYVHPFTLKKPKNF